MFGSPMQFRGVQTLHRHAALPGLARLKLHSVWPLAALSTQAALQPGLTLISDCRNCDQGSLATQMQSIVNIHRSPISLSFVQMCRCLLNSYLSKLLT